eukprot:1554869-Amphidinium_carterae.1
MDLRLVKGSSMSSLKSDAGHIDPQYCSTTIHCDTHTHTGWVSQDVNVTLGCTGAVKEVGAFFVPRAESMWGGVDIELNEGHIRATDVLHA